MIFSQLRSFIDTFHRGCSGILSRIMLHMNPRACRELGWVVLVCLTKKKIQTNQIMQSVLQVSWRNKEIQKLLNYFERPSGCLMN